MFIYTHEFGFSQSPRNEQSAFMGEYNNVARILKTKKRTKRGGIKNKNGNKNQEVVIFSTNAGGMK